MTLTTRPDEPPRLPSANGGFTPRQLSRALVGAFLVFFVLQLALRFLVWWVDPGAQSPARWRVSWTSNVLFFTWGLVIPWIVRWVHRRPLERRRILRQLGHHGLRVMFLAWLVASFFFVVGRTLRLSAYSYTAVMPKVMPLFMITSALFYSAVAAVVSLTVGRDRLHRLELDSLRLRAELEAARVRLAKTQLEPLFMARTIERIEALVDQDIDRADAAITRLADILRLNLDMIQQSSVSLVEEVDYLEALAELSSVVHGREVRIETDLSRGALATTVPPFTLRQLAEQAIENAAPDRLLLRARTTADALLLELWGDGERSTDEGGDAATPRAALLRRLEVPRLASREDPFDAGIEETPVVSLGRGGPLDEVA